MAIKKYEIYCNNCSYKRYTDGSDVKDLFEVKTTPVQTVVPHIDPLTKKMVPPKFRKQKKKFKCPNCGYTITPRKIDEKNNSN